MLFGPETFEVIGLIDWESASIIPGILCARYPSELESGRVADDPNTTTAWRFYSYDYTFDFPSINDLGPYIDATWNRFIYSGLLAEMDSRLSTQFWKKSVRVLQVYEINQAGFEGWLRVKNWLEETVLRINEEASKE